MTGNVAQLRRAVPTGLGIQNDAHPGLAPWAASVRACGALERSRASALQCISSLFSPAARRLQAEAAPV